jgi:uncharacterized protein with PIN domain
MPQPNEVRCTQCKGVLFKVEGSKVIQITGGRTTIFEPVGSVTTKCKCNKVNVFVPQPVKRSLAVAV